MISSRYSPKCILLPRPTHLGAEDYGITGRPSIFPHFRLCSIISRIPFILHTYSTSLEPEGLDVHFEGYDIWPTIWPSSLSQNSLTLAISFLEHIVETHGGGGDVTFLIEHTLRGCRWLMCVSGVMTFDIHTQPKYFGHWQSRFRSISQKAMEITFTLHTHIT